MTSKLLILDPVLRDAGHYDGRNFDTEASSIIRRLISVEERIDVENRRKAMIYAEAKISSFDIGALKAVVRTIRYLPDSNAGDLRGLSETVKRYLDLAIGERR
jgi:uncharacterized protein (UPF0335 family)